MHQRRTSMASLGAAEEPERVYCRGLLVVTDIVVLSLQYLVPQVYLKKMLVII